MKATPIICRISVLSLTSPIYCAEDSLNPRSTKIEMMAIIVKYKVKIPKSWIDKFLVTMIVTIRERNKLTVWETVRSDVSRNIFLIAVIEYFRVKFILFFSRGALRCNEFCTKPRSTQRLCELNDQVNIRYGLFILQFIDHYFRSTPPKLFFEYLYRLISFI